MADSSLRVLRVRDGEYEQECIKCHGWFPLGPDNWRARSGRGSTRTCVDCARLEWAEKAAERKAERRMRRPDYRHVRILDAPGSPVWQYRDLKQAHIRDMLEAEILPVGTKLMDYERRQFVVRRNGEGHEMAELPPERWHDFSAPGVRLNSE